MAASSSAALCLLFTEVPNLVMVRPSVVRGTVPVAPEKLNLQPSPGLNEEVVSLVYRDDLLTVKDVSDGWWYV